MAGGFDIFDELARNGPLRTIPFKKFDAVAKEVEGFLTGDVYSYSLEDVPPAPSWRRVNEPYQECTGLIKPRTEYLRLLTPRQARLSRFRQHRQRDWQYRKYSNRCWARWVQKQKTRVSRRPAPDGPGAPGVTMAGQFVRPYPNLSFDDLVKMSEQLFLERQDAQEGGGQ